MAKIQIKHIDAYSDTDYIECVPDLEHNLIYVQGVSDDHHFCVVLDVSTSIKLAKTLRTDINKVKGI
tara:strand:- start:26205 stop:26405 length:201 start_codon:yes stop_codon:yes gene_type:complete